jgi:hypothetical protein
MKVEKTWTTWHGQTMKVENLSHQHLSNIMHYFNLVLEMGCVEPIAKEINRRFGGIRLPYHPMISFKYEIAELVKKGYTSGEPNADIIVDSKWIGQIKYS